MADKEISGEPKLKDMFKGKSLIIAQEILKHRNESSSGYSSRDVLDGLKKRGLKNVSRQHISYVAQRLKENNWGAVEGEDREQLTEEKPPGTSVKTQGKQSQEGALYSLSGLFPALKFIVGQKTEVINPEDIHVVYDIYLDAKQNYGWPYDFSSLIRCSGRLFGLMMRLTQGGDHGRLIAEPAEGREVHAGKTNEGRSD